MREVVEVRPAPALSSQGVGSSLVRYRVGCTFVRVKCLLRRHAVDIYEPICDEIAQLVAETRREASRPQVLPKRVSKG